MKKLFAIFLLLHITIISHSQDSLAVIIEDSIIGTHKYGSITSFERDLKFCSFDSSAKAVVLFRSGVIAFDYKDGLRLYIHERMKILDNTGVDYATISIPYSKVSFIRAESINYDENGNEIISKLDSTKIYTDGESSRFAIPNVKAGSIVEYSYLYKSSNFKQITWDFQTTIPTLESEVELYTGVYKFDFSPIMIGKKLIQSYHGKSVHHWKLSNMPAIKEEPYSTNRTDYIEKIIFKASGFYKSLPYYSTKSERGFVEYHTSWEQVAESCISDPEFKSFRPHKKFAEKILDTIIESGDHDSIKMIKIYDFVRSNYEWNGKRNAWLYHKFNSFKKSNGGNSAEINLFLASLLKSAGLKAYVALISTKDNGRIINEYPILSQFNQMLAFVKIDSTNYFLNATDHLRPYYMLDDFDYNQKALILEEDHVRWENLPNPLPSKLIIQTQINITEDSAIYTLKLKAENQKAYKYINKLGNNKSKTAFQNYILKVFDEIENISIHWLKHSEPIISNNPFIVEFEVAFAMEDIENGNLFELIPNHIVSWVTNPFITEGRQLPVDFYSSIYIKNIVSIQTSDNYIILNDPQSLRLKLPYKGGYYSGSLVKHSEQKMMMICNINLKKSIFYQDEYLALREMISQMIDFEFQRIILQKK